MSTVHTVNSDQATFLGMGFEALAYGIYTLLFFTSLAVLTWRTPALNASKKPMFAATIFMFSLATVHFSLNFNNVYQGLMVKPTAHISDETHLLAGADMIFSISDFCSQLILIYRCYLVWSRNPWVIVLPILISCASVACGIGLIGLVLTISPNAPQAPAAIVPIGTAAFSMSLCLNFIVSALIVGRIWYITGLNREIKTDSAIRRASAIIIESGLLFLAAQLVFVVLFAIKHPAQAIVEPIATQIYGISPTLIIVRVGMGSTFEPTALPESSLRFRVTLGRKTKSTTTGTSRMTATTGSATDVEMGRLPSESSFVKSRNDE
ncbi:uncharacterized protein C8R40DRAFT_1110676 [Lentinula edodes]|uniref:uncharacterized protein n=1 Tax=Lentinula edodes TaxID=5353 RepID=UPI001E8D73B7|nr:uncharacterized protein C8R40DRAFT_1110676 [Lentinula edodes]KAH7873978.1 hypothetical protein C8R40DRAFT_1110676 [Lentinula edodes]